jgi:hypothetical protein
MTSKPRISKYTFAAKPAFRTISVGSMFVSSLNESYHDVCVG